jgi:hypothetical protein
VVGNRPHKPAIENSTGHLIPLFVFERVQKSSPNARGGTDFVQRYAAHLAFAAQMLAESGFRGGLIHLVE